MPSYHHSPIIKYLMMISKLLLLVLIIPLIFTQGGQSKSFLNAISSIKKSLSHVSLVGSWKFSQDSNFVINKKITMINQASNSVLRNNDKMSFISSDSSMREAEAYFDSDRQGQEPKSLYIELYDGKYYTNNTVALEIDLRELTSSHRVDANVNLWNNTKSIIVVCMLIHNKRIIAQMSTHARVEIFTNAKDNDLKNKKNRIFLKFQSNTFSFYAELKFIENQYDQLAKVQAIYSVLLLLILIFKKPKKSLYSISEWMILQAFAFVIVVSWLFIRLSMQKMDTSLKLVGLCAFINICLAFFFLRNYEEVLKSFKGKIQRIAAIAGLFSYFFLCYLYQESLTFWIFQSFCLLALQINYSYSMGGRGGLSVTLVATLIFMRFPHFYYLFACPQITRQPTDTKSMGIFMIVNGSLLIFIIMQRYFGSRFMIPKQLIPDYFNFFQKIKVEDEILEQVCPICTLKLKDESALNQEEQANQEIQLQQTIQQQAQPQSQDGKLTSNYKIVMTTPCNHRYHPSCLQQWMEKRLMCPTCRRDLPPSERQRDDSYCC